MTDATLGKYIRNAGKAFLACRMEDLVLHREELEEEEGFEEIVEAYFNKQSGHHDEDIKETRERVQLAKEIIEEDRYIDCLEILAETKSLKPEFRQKAKNSLKKLNV